MEIRKMFAILAFVALAVTAVPVGFSMAQTTTISTTTTTTTGGPTVAQLQALIAQLQAQIALLMGGTGSGTGVGSGQSGVTQGFIFTRDLTIGSRGQDVIELQRFLVARGHLTIPAGVAYGYFGTLTRAAVSAFQSANGISPTAGYFGPITRARINTIVQTPVTTPGTGTGGGTTTPGTGITTPGVEGTLSVTSSSAGIRSTVYEGEDRVPILGMDVEARLSDIAIQRIRLNLGSSSSIYNDIFSRLYVTDSGGTTLASTDLNSSTVTREGGTYYVTITGFNYIVPRNTERQLIIRADVQNSIDSTDLSSDTTIQLADNGVRGIDGAGIDHFAPANGSAVSRSINIDAALSESSTLRISLNTSSPQAQEVVAASGGSENELDRLTTLMFDLRAERDDVVLRDLNIGVTKSGSGTAAATTAYLYEGSNEIENAAISNGVARFTDIDYRVPRDSTRTLSVRLDIRNANATVANFVTTASSSSVTAENTDGDNLSTSEISGSAIGETISVRNVGPEISLVSKSITTSGSPQGGGSNNISTSSLTATFNVRIRAVGSDITFGTSASSSPLFSTFRVYRNGAVDNTISSAATSTSFSTPSGVTTSGLTNSFTLAEGNEVTIPVTFQILGRQSNGVPLQNGLYSIALEGIQWTANGTTQTSTFMAGDVDWRTQDVSFP